MRQLIADTISKIFSKDQPEDKVILADATTALKRDETFLKNYEIWKSSGKSTELLNELKANFLQGEPVEGSMLNINFHYTPGANGFSIEGSEKIETAIYRYLADYFKEKVLPLNYRLYSAVSETKNRVDRVINLERYYFKPAAWSPEPPLEQLFGNILIELEMSGGKVDYLKVLATYYTGFDYKPAKSFDELALLMLDEDDK
jgi:hypothetical protein